MEKKLRDLYATLLRVETKGESTMVMADCVKFLGQCIPEVAALEKENLDMKKEIKELNEKIVELNMYYSEKEVKEDEGSEEDKC